MTTGEHDFPIEPSIDASRFFDREWDDDEQLRDAFEWVVPDRFNAATYVRDRWAEAEPDRVALVVVDPDGTDAEYTYGRLQRSANQLANCLAAHEPVANAGAIGVPDDTRGEIPKAFVQLAEGHEPTEELEERLQAHVKDRLAKHEYPRELEFVAALPLTTTGKVGRRDLREREGLAE